MPVLRTGLGLVAAALMALPAAAQDATVPDIPAPEIPPIATPPVLPNSTIPSPEEAAESAPILTLDQEVLYLSSAWGLRAQARLEAKGKEVTAENDRLTQLLSSEEARLTEQRSTLPAAEFRELAESFDIRATRIRRERAQAVQDLNAWAEADRAAFFRAALPVMGQVMQDRGAVAVLDRRTIFVSLDAIDVTEQLVAALDDRIGDGEGVVPLPEPPPSEDAP
ncbi:OmpH family outer membrane protein [Paracoccus marcusii]|uniref:OmpH family outer membrane protein n=1 Tax=Paracoccus marcusii TaxID=59779 RepID=UPI0038B9C6AD